MILKPPPQFTWKLLLSLTRSKESPSNKNYWEEDLLHGQDIKIQYEFYRPMLKNPRKSWSSGGLPAVYSVSMLVQLGFWFPIVRGIPEILWVVFLIPDSTSKFLFYRIPVFPVIHKENSRLTKQGRLCSQAQYKPGFLTPYILKETARLTILKRLCSLAQRVFLDKGRGGWFSKTLLICVCVAGPGLPLKNK